ncbi:MAG: site-2 protease family protein [Deltaproteobacteria bacterium]|nr:site-2 protease family protein [Deltaproteobacteria bacterium]
MGLIKLLFNDPLTFVLLAVPLLYSIIVHELAHGWVAYAMGDPTAKSQGRLTLNPLKHLDPIGTAMLFIFGFGWAKPVPVHLGYVRNARLGLILVSSAGIVANTLFAFLAVLLLQLFAPSPEGSLATLLYFLAQINIMLASFNLIPIPPLDGSKILMGFLPEGLQDTLSRLEPYGFFIIIGLLYLGALDPVIRFFRWLILGLMSLLIA